MCGDLRWLLRRQVAFVILQMLTRSEGSLVQGYASELEKLMSAALGLGPLRPHCTVKETLSLGEDVN
jgi:hypothetical protein